MDIGNGLGLWKTMPTRRRNSTTLTSGSVMFSPSRQTSPRTLAPGIRSFMRLKQRRNVDLPLPDGPIKAMIERAWTVRETSRTATFSP